MHQQMQLKQFMISPRCEAIENDQTPVVLTPQQLNYNNY